MTELIWDGKYLDGKKQSPVRVALPFQTIETVNESAADRQRTLLLDQPCEVDARDGAREEGTTDRVDGLDVDGHDASLARRRA